jgi:hypothetical protein
MEKTKPFYLRLSETARELLDKASDDLQISRAKVIDRCIQDQLKEKYSDVGARLDKMLGQKQ